jgi:hypothetical protein
MASVNIRALWGGAMDSGSDSESDASILGELKDDAVYEDDSDYDFDRLPQKSEMNPARLNMEEDMVSIGSSSDDEFHVPTAKDYRRTRDFEEDDAISYGSDSSYELLAEKKSLPKVAGLKGDEFEDYIATRDYEGNEEENMNDADVDLAEVEEYAGDEQTESLAKLRGELKGLSGIKASGQQLAKAKETVEEALERAMAGISGAVKGRKQITETRKTKLRHAVEKLRGKARSSRLQQVADELESSLVGNEEDKEYAGFVTPTQEQRAKGSPEADEQETQFDEVEDIEADEFDESVSRSGTDPMSLYTIEGRPILSPVRREIIKRFSDPIVERNYKSIVRQVGSKKTDILRFLQQNDEWISEADTQQKWTKQKLEAELKMFIQDRLETEQEIIFEGRVRGVSAETVRSPEVQRIVKDLKKEGTTTKDKKTAFIQSLGIPFSPRGLSLQEVDEEFQKAVGFAITLKEGEERSSPARKNIADRLAKLQAKLNGGKK